MTRSRSALRLLATCMLVVVLTLALAGPAAAGSARPYPGVDATFSAETNSDYPNEYEWHLTDVSWIGFQKVSAVELAATWTCAAEYLSGSAQLDILVISGKAPLSPQDRTLESSSWTTLSENSRCSTRIDINIYGGGGKLLLTRTFATYDGYYVSY